MRELTFDFDQRGDVVVARLDGEIDSSNARELQVALAARRQVIRLIVPETAPVRRVLELCAVESVAPIDGDLTAVLAAAEPTD